MMVSAPPQPYRFVLTKADLYVAVPVGAKRRAFHILADHFGKVDPDRTKPRHDLENDHWNSVIAACTEYGVAKILGRFWPGDFWSRKHTVDVPPDIEVRYTNKPHLLLYDNDHPEFKYVLVAGNIPEFSILGWFPGADGLKPETLKELKRGVIRHAIPIHKLRPFEELLKSY